jgi:hypothetical protein
MQKRSCFQGLTSFFFQPPANRGDAHRIDDLELNELVGEERQRPSCPTMGWSAACQLNETSFRRAIQLGYPGWPLLFLSIQDGLQPVEAAALANLLRRGFA